MTEQTAYPRRYLKMDFKPVDLDSIEEVYKALLEREISDLESLESWCRDWSEVDSTIGEEGARRFVQHTCYTDDAEITENYMEWIEKIQPCLKKISFDMDRKFIASPAIEQLPEQEFGIWVKSVNNSVELFREENIPLQTEETKLDAKYDETIGAMSIEFDGEARTLPYMGRILEETDRDRREQSFRATWDRILEDQDKIEGIFDRQVELRHQMALNAGFDDYRALRFRQLERFDNGQPHNG